MSLEAFKEGLRALTKKTGVVVQEATIVDESGFEWALEATSTEPDDVEYEERLMA